VLPVQLSDPSGIIIEQDGAVFVVNVVKFHMYSLASGFPGSESSWAPVPTVTSYSCPSEKLLCEPVKVSSVKTVELHDHDHPPGSGLTETYVTGEDESMDSLNTTMIF